MLIWYIVVDVINRLSGPAHVQPTIVEGGGGRTSPVFIRNGVHKPHSKGPQHSKKTMHTVRHSVQSPKIPNGSNRNIHSITHSTVSVHAPRGSSRPHYEHVQHSQHQIQRQKSTKSVKSVKSIKSSKSPKSTKSPKYRQIQSHPNGHTDHHHDHQSQHHYHPTFRSPNPSHQQIPENMERPHHSEYDGHSVYQSAHHQQQQTETRDRYREQLRPSLATRQSSGSRHSRGSRSKGSRHRKHGKHHKSKSHFSPRTSSGQMTAMDKDLIIASLEEQLHAQEEVISALTADLSKAQQTILCMTSMVDVNQKLPTVDELQSKYQSIRDQQHADTSTALKQWIRTLSPQWPKAYISQIVHQLLFEVLMQCYSVVADYKLTVYRNIGVQLGMMRSEKELSPSPSGLSGHRSLNRSLSPSVSPSPEEGSERSRRNDGVLNEKQSEILQNLLGGYFRNNFERILRRKKVVQKVMATVHAKWTSLEMPPFEEGSAAMEHLADYVDRSCSVCWMMLLQDPPLQFHPNRWSAVNASNSLKTKLLENEGNTMSNAEDQQVEHHKNQRIAFDENRHKRVIGSDRRSHNVLYFVWPALSNGSDLCGNGKMDVVVRDRWPQMTRRKKERPPHKARTGATVLSVVHAITDQEVARKQKNGAVASNHSPDLSQFQYSSTDDEPWPCMNKQCAVYINKQFEVIHNGRRQRTCPGCGTARWSPSQQKVFVD